MLAYGRRPRASTRQDAEILPAILALGVVERIGAMAGGAFNRLDAAIRAGPAMGQGALAPFTAFSPNFSRRNRRAGLGRWVLGAIGQNGPHLITVLGIQQLLGLGLADAMAPSINSTRSPSARIPASIILSYSRTVKGRWRTCCSVAGCVIGGHRVARIGRDLPSPAADPRALWRSGLGSARCRGYLVGPQDPGSQAIGSRCHW